MVRYCFLFLLICFSDVLFSQKIEFQNQDFEAKTGQLSNWELLPGTNAQINVDRTVLHSGLQSVNIEHLQATQSKLLSPVVTLEVGMLYKLSAWIRTRNAHTNGSKQYPTPVAACITMQSTPFTNNSVIAGGTTEWGKIEYYFFATQKTDRISLNFGYNGDAAGSVWFDDIVLEKTFDLAKVIDPNSIKTFEKAYRYEDKGWINLHIEGSPYIRGRQHGYLMAAEIKEFINKLSIQKQKDNPQNAWNNLKTTVDLLFLRKFENEFIEEMKGIADGINLAGVDIFNRKADLLDIVTINSEIDLDYASDAIRKTPNQLTGRTLPSMDLDDGIPNRLHKCSGVMATKTATRDHRVVFGQLFMWGGYTGPHWNVLLDLKPENGHRLVYQTFPGGIHSGADFYLNEKGIVIGETTVGQTPFNSNGTPQSNRIRKAAQYAESIDDVTKIMTTDNNGLYTNDWLIADTKTDEIGILLLGTNTYKLWRSTRNDFYGGQKDWYWSNNNTKDLEVRKEYRVNDENAPVDLTFRPWDRDKAFFAFYDSAYGKMDASSIINLLATSPINRPHACDGKVITSEMAEKMMFFAHSGKVTLRDAYVNENGRIPDLPGATPRLSLGYSTCNPLFIEAHIQELLKAKNVVNNPVKPVRVSDVLERYSLKSNNLWYNTVYPADESVNWFNSASAAYWNIIKQFSDAETKNFKLVKDEFTELNNRYLFTVTREKDAKAIDGKTDYSRYGSYYIPKIKGTYLLHQLRLLLGDSIFTIAMKTIHTRYHEKNITNKTIVEIFNQAAGKDLQLYFDQWLNRTGIPTVSVTHEITVNTDSTYTVHLRIQQDKADYYRFTTSVALGYKNSIELKKVVIDKSDQKFEIVCKEKPESVVFNYSSDIPTERKNFYSFSNFYDDFSAVLLVYGSKKEIESNHNLAIRYSKTLADRFSEIVLPIVQDAELTEDDATNHDLILLGNPGINEQVEKMGQTDGITLSTASFTAFGKTYTDNDDGIFYAIPNPANKSRFIFVLSANSTLQLYQMLKNVQRLPGYAIYKGDQVVVRGYLPD